MGRSENRYGISESRPESGFTLLELIIVIAIIVIVLGLSSVFFASTIPSAKLNGLTREVSAMIRQARVLAKNRGEMQALVMDLDARTYGLEGQTPKLFPPEITVRVMDPLSGEVTNGRYTFVFHGAGGAEGGTILLSYNRKTVAIETDPIVGSVIVKQ
jgi:general secretion pathway protein H